MVSEQMIKKYLQDGRAPIPVNKSTSIVISSIKDRDTKPELTLRKTLWHSGLKAYGLHWKQAPVRPDIAFPDRKAAIFVNGCFWRRSRHCNPPFPKSNGEFWKEKFEKNVERDFRKVTELENDGRKVLTICECQIMRDLQYCIHSINNPLLE